MIHHFLDLKHNTMLISFKNYSKINEEIWNHVKPIVERWSDEKLLNEFYTYGVRRYLRGSTLAFHVDKLPTHVLSVIMQVNSLNLSPNSKHYHEPRDQRVQCI